LVILLIHFNKKSHAAFLKGRGGGSDFIQKTVHLF